MKAIILIFLMMIECSQLRAQNLVWERDTLIDAYLGVSLFPSIIDNNTDIVTLIDEGSFESYDYHFVKYDLKGNLKSWKKYSELPPLCPMNFYQNDNGGYKGIFQTMDSFSRINYSQTQIVEFSTAGDTLNHYIHSIPEDDPTFDQNSTKFMLVQFNNNTLYLNGTFINAFIKDNIRINETSSYYSPHLIIQFYDTLGIQKFRKGIDTVRTNDGQYNFYDLKQTKDNNFIILAIKKSTDISNAILQIIKISTDGLILNKIEFSIKDRPFAPRSLEELPNGDYAVLGKEISSLNLFILRLDSKGKLIYYKDISKKNAEEDMFNIKSTPTGNLIATGKTRINNSSGYNYMNLIVQFDSNLDEISNLQWYEYTKQQGSSGLRQIIFVNNLEFIGIGYKDYSKYYIARFQIPSTEVYYNKSIVSSLFKPNPVSDFIEICTSNVLEKIEIYSILGLKVLETEWKERINVSCLPASVYFIRIGDRFEKFVKI